MYIYTYICNYIHMFVCIHTDMYAVALVEISSGDRDYAKALELVQHAMSHPPTISNLLYIHIYMYIYVYICIYVYTYMYIYIYIHIYIYVYLYLYMDRIYLHI